MLLKELKFSNIPKQGARALCIENGKRSINKRHHQLTANTQQTSPDNQEPATTTDSDTRQSTVSTRQPTSHWTTNNYYIPTTDTPDKQNKHPTTDRQQT